MFFTADALAMLVTEYIHLTMGHLFVTNLEGPLIPQRPSLIALASLSRSTEIGSPTDHSIPSPPPLNCSLPCSFERASCQSVFCVRGYCVFADDDARV